MKASRIFFQKLEILDLLTDIERHSIIKNAFAKNLYNISQATKTHDSTKAEVVEAVVTCFVGNPYGVSHAAVPYYGKMIENFSPKEIEILLDLPEKKSQLLPAESRCTLTVGKDTFRH